MEGEFMLLNDDELRPQSEHQDQSPANGTCRPRICFRFDIIFFAVCGFLKREPDQCIESPREGIYELRYGTRNHDDIALYFPACIDLVENWLRWVGVSKDSYDCVIEPPQLSDSLYTKGQLRIRIALTQEA